MAEPPFFSWTEQSMASAGGEEEILQSVLVMRHGDRIDHLDPMWLTSAARPWDPPLAEGGLIRAWATGKQLRDAEFPIQRILVSPFLRCLQTAVEVVRALCCVVDDPLQLLAMGTSRDAVLDPSRVKVSIEYGLCEMLNTRAIGSKIAPKDNKWFPHISELESLLPAGTLDQSAERIYKEMPQWEESVVDARNRYMTVIQALADKYPTENLLLVSHGECVGSAVTLSLKDAMVFEAEYCAYCHLQRNIVSNSSESSGFRKFKVLTESGQTGVSYTLTYF